MIRLLTDSDSEKYLEHLLRVATIKGMRAIKSGIEIEKLSDQYYNIEYTRESIATENNYFWGEFDENNEIISSMMAAKFKNEPTVFFRNFKSEAKKFFNPHKNVLKFAEAAFTLFEQQSIYKFILIRPPELFNSTRFSNIEDSYPLDRYNSYFDELIPAHHNSKWPIYNFLLRNRTYDIDLVVVHMCLKQQYRKYGAETVLLPLTLTKTN